ncbi:MAG: amino acid ABC transporter permease [Mesorhizobium amorphae]|nr:MAG: amino acid ABC transporter permease [Mesorhizobium amorphae]
MARIGVSPGFGFLRHSANFAIGESVISFAAGDPYLRAILAGLLNTLKVAALGCVFATLLGVAFGVAGLSSNPLLARLVRVYVEGLRNTPLLLQLFFWIALAKSLPAPRQAIDVLGAVFLSNRGVFVPSLSLGELGPVFWGAWAVLLAALLAAAFSARGRVLPRGAWMLFAVLLAPLLAAPFAAGGATWQQPVLQGFNIRGGWAMTPEFAALLAGLSVKFSAAIAEIVRAGIQSVSRGQWEAARALGLRPASIMRLVVLPQALRVITPLTTSSYLDLIKDSSLAVAIGYPDLVSIINTTANTTGQSLEALTILIGLYLVLNLAASALMNLYNRRVALRGGTMR